MRTLHVAGRIRRMNPRRIGRRSKTSPVVSPSYRAALRRPSKVQTANVTLTWSLTSRAFHRLNRTLIFTSHRMRRLWHRAAPVVQRRRVVAARWSAAAAVVVAAAAVVVAVTTTGSIQRRFAFGPSRRGERGFIKSQMSHRVAARQSVHSTPLATIDTRSLVNRQPSLRCVGRHLHQIDHRRPRLQVIRASLVQPRPVIVGRRLVGPGLSQAPRQLGGPGPHRIHRDPSRRTIQSTRHRDRMRRHRHRVTTVDHRRATGIVAIGRAGEVPGSHHSVVENRIRIG